MPFEVRYRSPATKILLLEESFQDAVPGIKFSYKALTYSSAFTVSGELMTTLSFLSTRLPPCAHNAQCSQVLASPEAWPSAKPAGVLFFFSALTSSRKPPRSFGGSFEAGFSIRGMRGFIRAPGG